jgi:hypothetical protein
LVSWNEKAITMSQTMFRDERIYLMGVRPADQHGPWFPRRFAWTGKGSDAGRLARATKLIFSPHLSDHDKLVMGLAGRRRRAWSREEWQRNNIGIPDSEAMEEANPWRSDRPTRVLGAIVQSLQQDPSPEAAQTAEQEGIRRS